MLDYAIDNKTQTTITNKDGGIYIGSGNKKVLIGRMTKDGVELTRENTLTIGLVQTINSRWSIAHKLEKENLKIERNKQIREESNAEILKMWEEDNKSKGKAAKATTTNTKSKGKAAKTTTHPEVAEVVSSNGKTLELVSIQ